MEFSSDEESESPSGPSESTRIFAAQVSKEFDKHFPAKSDLKNRMPSFTSLRPRSSFALYGEKRPISKISLDETFSAPTRELNLNAQFINMKEQLELHKRKIQMQKKEVETATEQKRAAEGEAEGLRRQNTELRAQVKKLTDENRELDLTRPSRPDCLNGPIYKQLAEKQFIWLQWKDAQLNECARLLLANKKWTKENRFEIQKSYRMMEPERLTDELAAQLAPGSALDFVGIDGEGMDEEQQEEINQNEAINVHDATISTAVESEKKKTDIFAESFDLYRSALDSSIYEKDERISELEWQNDKLKDKLMVSQNNAQKYIIVREEKISLEEKYRLLNKSLNDTLAELEAVRSVNVAALAASSSPDRATARLLHDRIAHLNARVRDLEVELRNEKEMTARHADDIRAMAASESERVEQVQQEMRERVREAEEAERQAKEQCNQIRMEITFIKEQTPATDAGDSTQICHMKRNPFDAANEELMEQEEMMRKRELAASLDSSSSQDGAPLAKRAKEDVVELERKILVLENALRQKEKEKERTVSIHAEITRKYREVSTTLTGLQVKMKDEKNCQVTSVYDPVQEPFVFQFDNEGRVNLLGEEETTSITTSRPSHRFSSEMEEMIGRRQSIPAFFASVTLRLERERAAAMEEETLMMNTRGEGGNGDGGGAADSTLSHTFSVLHED